MKKMGSPDRDIMGLTWQEYCERDSIVSTPSANHSYTPKGPHTYSLCGKDGSVTYITIEEWWPSLIIWKNRYFILCEAAYGKYEETTKFVLFGEEQNEKS